MIDHFTLRGRNLSAMRGFHRAGAIVEGGIDNGAPGLRPHDRPKYDVAFVLDPDGNNAEAVCHDAATS